VLLPTAGMATLNDDNDYDDGIFTEVRVTLDEFFAVY
jgi:hypothetical protein